MKKSFSIKAKVWRWPGDGGWHFVTLDKKLGGQIRAVHTRGHVPILVKVLKSTWNASLLWHSVGQTYLLCITKKVRKNEGLFEGDTIKVNFTMR